MNRINWPDVDTLMVDCDGDKIFNKSLVTGNPKFKDSDKVIGRVYYNKNFAAFWVFAEDKSYNQPLNCSNWWKVVKEPTCPPTQT